MKRGAKTPELPFDVAGLVSADLVTARGERVDVDDVRRYLASAEVVDEASPAVRDWSYAPWMDGSFVAAGEPSPIAIRIFHGGRARITMADGRSVLIDGDAALLRCDGAGHGAEILPGERFSNLWAALGARDHGWAIFRTLRESYDEPHRAYHDARHVCACLGVFDDPEVRALATHPAEVEAALWFHDAVYDTHATDNEERSAELAEETLQQAGVDASVVARIGAHVRATKDHVATTDDAKLVVDIDLSILGEDAAVFARFEDAIRREYAWVDPAAYASGRSAVLSRFLARPAIYATALFRTRYEARARENLSAALSRLRRETRR